MPEVPIFWEESVEKAGYILDEALDDLVSNDPESAKSKIDNARAILNRLYI